MAEGPLSLDPLGHSTPLEHLKILPVDADADMSTFAFSHEALGDDLEAIAN